MGSIYTVCVYLDPDGPESMSPAGPPGYRLASFQWLTPKNRLIEGNRNPNEKWSGTDDDPKLVKGDQLAFYLAWASSKDEDLGGETATFRIHWKNRKGDRKSPLLLDDGSPKNTLSNKPCFSDQIQAPGLPGPRHTWLFGPYPIKDPESVADTDELRFSFTVATGKGESGYFLDPEMETRP